MKRRKGDQKKSRPAVQDGFIPVRLVESLQLEAFT